MDIQDQGMRIYGLMLDCDGKIRNVQTVILKETSGKPAALDKASWLERSKEMSTLRQRSYKTLDSRPLKDHVKDPDAVEAQLEALKKMLDKDAMDMVLFATQKAPPEDFSPSTEQLAEAERMHTKFVDEINDLPLSKTTVAICELNKAIPVLEKEIYSDVRIKATNEARPALVDGWKKYAKEQYNNTYAKYYKAFI